MESVYAVFLLALVAGSQAQTTDDIPAAATKLGLNTLVANVDKAGLTATLQGTGPFTVFGPTDDAFKNLPEPIKQKVTEATELANLLKFHVLNGKTMAKDLKNEAQLDTVLGTKLRINKYKVGDKQVATAQCAPIDLAKVDKEASNGVIHVLNSVMIPPEGNIVKALSGRDNFKQLVKAVTDAKLVDTLNGDGPFTVFAPTDEAFAKIEKKKLEELLKDTDKLTKTLKYHVVSGTQCSSGLSSGKVKTLQGETVEIKVSDKGVMVDEANVKTADISVTNGVIHVIDKVLTPNSSNVVVATSVCLWCAIACLLKNFFASS